MRNGTQSRKGRAPRVCPEPPGVCRGESGGGLGGRLLGERQAVHGEPRRLSRVRALSRASGSHGRVLAGSSPNPRRFFLHSHAHTHVGAHSGLTPTETRQRPPGLPTDPPCVAQHSFIPSTLIYLGPAGCQAQCGERVGTCDQVPRWGKSGDL